MVNIGIPSLIRLLLQRIEELECGEAYLEFRERVTIQLDYNL